MSLIDEIKKEQQKMKSAPLKKRLRYFLDYYKEISLIIVAVIALVVLSIHFEMTSVDSICSGIFINCPLESEPVVNDLAVNFVVESGLEPSEAIAVLNTSFVYRLDDERYISESYNTGQTISAQIAASALDFVVGDLDAMQIFAYADYFIDLTTVLNKDQMMIYEPYFLYIDRSVLMSYQNMELDNEDSFIFTNPGKPDEMMDPIPVFINVGQCSDIERIYGEEKEMQVFAIAANTPHLEKALAFLDFMIEGQEGR